MNTMKRTISLTAALLLSAGCANNNQTHDTNAMTSEQSFVAWAQQHATAITSLNVTNDNRDLEAIKHAVGDAKVVALSEGFHNCKEMMELHHRTIRYLVEELGFNTIITESGLPESRAIHNYVLGEPATENMWRNGLNKMYSEWSEGRALIEWMREYSQLQGKESALHYYGADIAGFYRDWRPAFKQLTDYLDQVDADYSQQLKAAMTPTLEIMGDNARMQYQLALTPAQRSALALQLSLAVEHIRNQREAYLANSDRKEYEWALQTAVALQLADNYYTNARHRMDPTTSQYVGLNGREIAMSRNIMWAMQQRDDAKIILINHVIHTKTASQYQGGMWGNFTPMGQMLKQQLGDEMYVIGMAYGGGRFWHNWQKPAERRTAPIQDHKSDSLESTFKAIGLPQFFVDFGSAPTAAQHWLSAPTDLRENGYHVQIMPNEWDGCLYIDQVNPATPATKP